MGERFVRVRGTAAGAVERVRRVPWGEVRERAAKAWRGRAARVVVVVLVGLLGGSLGLLLGGRVTTPIGPADVELSVRPSLGGETVVDLSPLGKLSFDTHWGPLRVEAGITEIRLAAAEELFEDPEAVNQMAASIATEVRDGVVQLFLRALLVGGLGATVAGGVLFRDVRRTAGSATTGVAAVIAAGGLAAATFNINAITEPRYTGLLAGAPQAVGDATDAVVRFEEYREQLAGLVANVSTLYEVTTALPVFEGDESTIRVLHVSDLHLNPAAWNVIQSLTEQFQADFIVDSGDLTDRGSAAEDVFAEEISRLDTPYVWVRGNHDSMGTQRAVEAQDNAIVLDEDVVEVEGLTLYGAGDPRFTPDRAADNPSPEEVYEIGEGQAATLARAAAQIDILVMHDSLQAEPFSGQVPLVLAGHDHRRQTEVEPTGTQFLVQGSTGGAGLRGLETGLDTPTPFQASVLYFDAESLRLQARDDIDIGGLGLSSAQIERHVEEDPDREIVPAEDDESPTP